MGDLYGIEVYQLYPPDGPFWRMDQETGKPELFGSYDDAVDRANQLISRDDLTGFSFRAVEYRKD